MINAGNKSTARNNSSYIAEVTEGTVLEYTNSIMQLTCTFSLIAQQYVLQK
jgi:hypothetical protein